MCGEVENPGLCGLGLEAIFTRLRADVDLAAGAAVQLAERFDFLFGFRQRIELFIAHSQRGALDRFFPDCRITEREQGIAWSFSSRARPAFAALRLHLAQDR